MSACLIHCAFNFASQKTQVKVENKIELQKKLRVVFGYHKTKLIDLRRPHKVSVSTLSTEYRISVSWF